MALVMAQTYAVTSSDVTWRILPRDKLTLEVCLHCADQMPQEFSDLNFRQFRSGISDSRRHLY